MFIANAVPAVLLRESRQVVNISTVVIVQRPHNFIRVLEYHIYLLLLLSLLNNTFIEVRTRDSLLLQFLLFSHRNSLVLFAFRLSSLVPKLRKTLRDSNPGLFRILVIVPVIYSSKQLRSCRCSSIVICLLDTGTFSAGLRNGGTFP
jgi:hypothetical protein